jgi:uncharacterized protein (UPF0335 family)
MSGRGGVAGDQLRAFVERIEHVEEEIRSLTEVFSPKLSRRALTSRSSGR